jgi:flavin reductase (DIM6/NTAB) family NADH-FMN oxidoreductase RutF
MKQSLGAKTLVHPAPVWVVCAYDDKNKPNGATVAWGGPCCSKPPAVTISLRKATYTYGCIMKRRAYTVCVPSTDFAREADYFGIYSGKDENKFESCGLTAIGSDVIDAPYIEEFPLILECRLLQSLDLGMHTMFIGEIVDVKADPTVLSPSGQVDLSRLKPFVYGVGTRSYYELGALIGEAYTLGKKP